MPPSKYCTNKCMERVWNIRQRAPQYDCWARQPLSRELKRCLIRFSRGRRKTWEWWKERERWGLETTLVWEDRNLFANQISTTYTSITVELLLGPPYRNTTSGSDFDLSIIIDILFCIANHDALGCVFIGVTRLRRSESIYIPKFHEISKFTNELLLLPVSENKWSPYVFLLPV